MKKVNFGHVFVCGLGTMLGLIVFQAIVEFSPYVSEAVEEFFTPLSPACVQEGFEKEFVLRNNDFLDLDGKTFQWGGGSLYQYPFVIDGWIQPEHFSYGHLKKNDSVGFDQDIDDLHFRNLRQLVYCGGGRFRQWATDKMPSTSIEAPTP